MMNVRDVVRRLTRAVEEPVRMVVRSELRDPTVVTEGLTEPEAVSDLVAYRTGVGRRPEMTDDLRLKLNTVSEKLFGTTHAVHRPVR